MLTPAYVPQATSVHPDVYGAFYAFVLAFGLPAIPAENIYQGWQNTSTLPSQSNEYAIITILGTTRRGTTVDNFDVQNVPDDAPEKYVLRTMYETVVQVDLCSDTDLARQRACTLETAFGSFIGTEFFGKYAITPQFCSSIRESGVDGADQFVRRYSLDFNIQYWAGVDVGSAWFIDVNRNSVRDVDAFYSPHKET